MAKGCLPLQAGDIVDVIAPGWATPPESLIEVQNFLKKWKLIARIPKDIFEPHFLGSNTAATRFAHLEKALKAKDSKVIWCIRGGYGCIHLLPYLQKMRKPQTKKLLIGISDITSLHSYFNHVLKWPSLHGPLLDRLAQNLVAPEQLRELEKIVFGKTGQIKFEKLIPMNKAALVSRQIQSTVVGGNLIVFQSLIGTGFQVSLKNKIFFIEDIGERAYRIDRALNHLQQSADLTSAAALVFGDFMGGEEKDGQNHISELMQIWADRLKIPVLKGLPAGHGSIQRPVPFFTKAQLQLGRKPHLEIQTGILES